MVELIFLGTGDAFGSGGLSQTSFLINTPTLNLLVDCGCSNLISLKKHKLNPGDIDTIIISHFHADHFGGVPFYLREQRFKKREKPLTIIGPAGIENRISELGEHLFPSTEKFVSSFPVEYKEYTSWKSLHINDEIFILPIPVEHVPETLPHAVRLTCHGKIISYSGDTRWVGELITVSENADVFICECYSMDRPSREHMHYTALLENEKQLTAKKIFLTHCSEEVLKKVNELKYEIASEGKVVSL